MYSNELANGDKDDDKELEKEDDMEDDIVDYQGHTNRGYGSVLPTTFFADNHIMEGSMITTPREEGPTRNSIWMERNNIFYLFKNNFKQININRYCS